MDDEVKIIGDAEKSVPKFCTSVNFSKFANDSITMNFLVRSGKDSPQVLIETIMVDKDHAQKILETLERVIKKEV